jgi:hypothetical protein
LLSVGDREKFRPERYNNTWIRYLARPVMDRKLLLWIIAGTLIALALALLLPGGRAPEGEPRLPWQIETLPDGSTRVFGLTLGQSSLANARQELEADGALTLFRSPTGEISLEAYFERLFISGLKANLVLNLELDPAEAQAMYERGQRVSQLGSGTQKVELAALDRERMAAAPVRLITYLPTADLEPELLARLFGEPTRRIAELDSGIEHWLYPDKGLDIAVNPEGKEVFQYIAPDRFGELAEPLSD